VSLLADWLAHASPPEAGQSAAQRRALTAIRSCRTPALGGRVYRCAQCARADFAYHSCHHRACPRCGAERTAAWTRRQTARLLPVPYFLVTFTVPAPLRAAFAAEPKAMIDLLFTESAQALQTVAAQPRHLGAQLGLVGVLHTWGRQLQLHPHIHYIVPGGGLRADGRKWRKTRRPDWLLPAAPLAHAFRRGLEAALRAALPQWHARTPDACWREPWVVDLQAVGSGEAAVQYLARYVQRTAISAPRIIEATQDHVCFRYRDSTSGGSRRCTLEAREFLRRYLQHVLPGGIHRIRYFGWEHPAAHRRRRQVESVLAKVMVVTVADPLLSWSRHCPHCQAPALVCVGLLPRQARAPPFARTA
jgi:hypothetical protein